MIEVSRSLCEEVVGRVVGGDAVRCGVTAKNLEAITSGDGEVKGDKK